ncbi:Hypothetical protein A7982_06507 [Minicystis rosea]|nr:Hypothetical protein A7982_06507 [Minicystis rosea]
MSTDEHLVHLDDAAGGRGAHGGGNRDDPRLDCERRDGESTSLEAK